MTQRRKIKGIFEKAPGFDIWWIRYADAAGRERREKARKKGMAIKLNQKRKTGVMQCRKLPESLRRRDVSFSELTGNGCIEVFAGE